MNVNCPHCGTALNVSGFSPGANVKCSTCQKDFVVPQDTSIKVQPNPISVNASGSRSAARDRISKYPNLIKYLAILRVLVNIIFGLLLLGQVGILIALYMDVYNSMPGAQERLFYAHIAIVIGVVLTFLWRIINLAGLEFVQVIIDIEGNTRKMARR